MVLHGAGVTQEQFDRSGIGYTPNTSSLTDGTVLVHAYTVEEMTLFARDMWEWCQDPVLADPTMKDNQKLPHLNEESR
jgi:hypothetical protein